MTFSTRTLAITAGVLGIIIAVLLWRLSSERRAHQEQAFRADSIAAALDTTRAVSARAQKVLGDSLRGVERRAVQVVGITPDELDKALKRYSTSIVATIATIKPLIVDKTAPVTVDTALGERKATFVVDSAPYHVRAAVALPAPPASGRIGLSVRLDTAKVSYRIQCGKATAGGVKPASVEINSPPWLPISIASAQTTQDVCNDPQKRSYWLWWLGGGVGLGIALDHFLFGGR